MTVTVPRSLFAFMCFLSGFGGVVLLIEIAQALAK